MNDHNLAPTPEYLARRKAQLEKLCADLEALPKGNYVLELGCGHGHFLTALAEKDKREGVVRHYLGIDKNGDRIDKATAKSVRGGLPIHWLNNSIGDVMERWPEGRVVEAVYVLFPDPWPREKQFKNRFVNEKLLETLWKITGPNTVFTFRTDHDGYAAAVEELLTHSSQWELLSSAPFPEGLPATVFEGHHPCFKTLAATRRSAK